MTCKKIRLIIILFLAISTNPTNAQVPCLPEEECGGSIDDPPPSTPIDGGVSLLLGAAAIYGAKKLRQKRQDSKS